jgi:murein L,D-transpeptidase YafK
MKQLLISLAVMSLSIFVFWDKDLPKNSVIDYIEVHKSQRSMEVYSNGKILKTYKIALGFKPKGKKEFQGDGKTPEGIYYINDKNPNSVAYKNLGISYPNLKDINYARDNSRSPGGDIKIHGLMKKWKYFGVFHTCVDWTGGCIAVDNSDIDELYQYVKIGTKIKIIE